MTPPPPQSQRTSEQRHRYVRQGIVCLLLAIVLLLLASLLFSGALPDWNADGSRDAFPLWAIALLCASVVAGTMLVPLSLRAFVLALAPVKALAVALGVLIGLVGLVAVPVELWLVLTITAAQEPGSAERYESGDDWDWD